MYVNTPVKLPPHQLDSSQDKLNSQMDLCLELDQFCPNQPIVSSVEFVSLYLYHSPWQLPVKCIRNMHKYKLISI